MHVAESAWEVGFTPWFCVSGIRVHCVGCTIQLEGKAVEGKIWCEPPVMRICYGYGFGTVFTGMLQLLSVCLPQRPLHTVLPVLRGHGNSLKPWNGLKWRRSRFRKNVWLKPFICVHFADMLVQDRFEYTLSNGSKDVTRRMRLFLLAFFSFYIPVFGATSAGLMYKTNLILCTFQVGSSVWCQRRNVCTVYRGHHGYHHQ